MVFAYFCKVNKFSWFLPIFMVLVIFMKLAGFHGFCLLLLSRQNFMIVAYFHELGKIPWFLPTFMVLIIFMKLAGFHGLCLF